MFSRVPPEALTGYYGDIDAEFVPPHPTEAKIDADTAASAQTQATSEAELAEPKKVQMDGEQDKLTSNAQPGCHSTQPLPINTIANGPAPTYAAGVHQYKNGHQVIPPQFAHNAMSAQAQIAPAAQHYQSTHLCGSYITQHVEPGKEYPPYAQMYHQQMPQPHNGQGYYAQEHPMGTNHPVTACLKHGQVPYSITSQPAYHAPPTQNNTFSSHTQRHHQLTPIFLNGRWYCPQQPPTPTQPTTLPAVYQQMAATYPVPPTNHVPPNYGLINTENSSMYPPVSQHVPAVLTPNQTWYQIDPKHFTKVGEWKKKFPSTPKTNSVQEMHPYLEGIRIYAEEADNTKQAPSFIASLESCFKVHVTFHDREKTFTFDQRKTAVENLDALIQVYLKSQVLTKELVAEAAILQFEPTRCEESAWPTEVTKFFSEVINQIDYLPVNAVPQILEALFPPNQRYLGEMNHALEQSLHIRNTLRITTDHSPEMKEKARTTMENFHQAFLNWTNKELTDDQANSAEYLTYNTNLEAEYASEVIENNEEPAHYSRSVRSPNDQEKTSPIENCATADKSTTDDDIVDIPNVHTNTTEIDEVDTRSQHQQTQSILDANAAIELPDAHTHENNANSPELPNEPMTPELNELSTATPETIVNPLHAKYVIVSESCISASFPLKHAHHTDSRLEKELPAKQRFNVNSITLLYHKRKKKKKKKKKKKESCWHVNHVPSLLFGNRASPNPNAVATIVPSKDPPNHYIATRLPSHGSRELIYLISGLLSQLNTYRLPTQFRLLA